MVYVGYVHWLPFRSRGQVLDNMFQLWHMAEEDLLDDEQQYQLADTGQGYQRAGGL